MARCAKDYKTITKKHRDFEAKLATIKKELKLQKRPITDAIEFIKKRRIDLKVDFEDDENSLLIATKNEAYLGRKKLVSSI